MVPETVPESPYPLFIETSDAGNFFVPSSSDLRSVLISDAGCLLWVIIVVYNITLKRKRVGFDIYN